MSSVAAAGDGSNGAQAQLGDSHGGKAAEQGGVEGIEDVVEGVVDAEQIQEDKGIDASEEALCGVGEPDGAGEKEKEECEREGGVDGNSSVVKDLLTDLLQKVSEEDSAEESETPVRLRTRSRAASQEPPTMATSSKTRTSRQSSCEESAQAASGGRSRHSSSDQDGQLPSRRLRTRTAPPLATGNDAASIRANMEPVQKPVEPSVVVNVPKKKLRKDKTEFQHNKEARSEAEVLKRVAELQREGLWPKKMVKREGEGHGQGKIHWDFVLEEMVWLSGVVQQEVKTKKVNAKRCAMMIQKHFKDKELSVARAERNREANLKKIALTYAREVKTFWGNVNKLFEYRLKIKLDGKKKEALDQHLNFIVDKTEKYSSLLAESLAVEASGSKEGSAAPSRAESVMSGEVGGEQAEGDDEYSPDVDSDDDEETIDKEEQELKTEGDKGNENEIDMLENEADVPIEDLLKKYYPESVSDLAERATNNIVKEVTKDEKEDIEEKNEAVEEDVGGPGRSKRRRKPIDFEEVQARIKEEEEEGLQKQKEPEKNETENGKKEEVKKEEKLEGESSLEEYANLAAELAPTGNTLDTTTVKTKVPFLLKHTLREYQHIGLDWMVSLFERSLNGILADEMGLGKTIQTIAFLAHLALEKSMWGPHLIVVPTSVMLNWEMEIKKWCPAFKVLVYYGSQKDRRLKRQGWTKQNAFHICITSYKLVIQDHSSFRRFKWQYFILDEAQHIKNFKSQRWQLLLNFTSIGRLLLTGTPLQNNLMELWSLMHFLMPHVFESHRDFKEWFSNPMSGMVEGNSEYNDSLIKRLHKVLRPFILRRLKSEVEKQMPKKYEHLVKCPLSKRQRFLYDDFMSRAKTKETLNSGNLLSVINVLMQLRKCCNHPNLFEPRPTISPLVATPVQLKLPHNLSRLLTYQPLSKIDLAATPLLLSPLETSVSGYSWFRASVLRCPEGQMLNPPEPKPSPCPQGKMRLVLKAATPSMPSTLAVTSVMPHKFCMAEQHPVVGQVIPVRLLARPDLWLWDGDVKIKTGDGYFQPTPIKSVTSEEDVTKMDVDYWHPPKVYLPEMRGDKRKLVEAEKQEVVDPYQDIFRHARGIFSTSLFKGDQATSEGGRSPTKVIGFKRRKLDLKAREEDLLMPELETLKEQELVARRKLNLMLNDRRTCQAPIYGSELVELAQELNFTPKKDLRNWLENLSLPKKFSTLAAKGIVRKVEASCYQSTSLVPSMDKVLTNLEPIFKEFVMYVPAVGVTPPPLEDQFCISAEQRRFPGDFLQSRFAVQAPDTRLIQYDCGKLQILANLLRTLQAGGHRVLIFTQMTKMLDVLEAFLNYHGYVYMRLDGSTRVEMRQCLMERFNNDTKYFAFILSTRSGGVGINLTGADTVIFYDSDWNPTMDAQAQDRCHRIGQTRDVHIYRLVSERTVEENILKKANQKRLLGDIAIEGGNFTTAFFKKSTINDLFDNSAADTSVDDDEEPVETASSTSKKSIGAFENALATAEDATDILATKEARAEENADENDFKDEEDQFNAVLAELSSVERYALKHLESEQADYAQGQLDAAEAEIEARKEEFDAEKLEELTKEIRGEMGDESTDEEDDEKEDDNDEEEEEGDAEEDEEEEGNESEASEMEVGDYSPVESGSDDEDTIEKEEKEEVKEEFEIDMLENEAEVPIEELLKLYYPDQLKQMQGEVEQVEESNGVEEEGRRKTTRSRGAIEINLWDLENPEDTLKSSSVKK